MASRRPTVWGVAAVAAAAAASAGLVAGHRWWRQAQAARQRNRFLQAACDGDIATLVRFIRAGQDLAAADKNGSSALMLAAWAGRREAVLLLLHCGADVHAVSHHGWTALTYAARAGEAATVEALIEWGAEVNVIEHTTGATPLMFAAFVGSLECVELLLDAGANPLIRTKHGALAFAFAEENGHDGIAGMLHHRAADAQAETQAIKEQREAVAARHKAKQATELRKKQEQAYTQRIEEQRQRANAERENYFSSFLGQLETLSVGCYVPLDTATVRDIVRMLALAKWDERALLRGPGPVRRQRAPSTLQASNSFEPLHRDLLRRRAINALSRPMLSAHEIVSDSEESDSEEDEDSGLSSTSEDGDESDVTELSGGDPDRLDEALPDPPALPAGGGQRGGSRPPARASGSPLRLQTLLGLVHDALERLDDANDTGEMDHHLAWAARAVSFGNSNELGLADDSAIDLQSPAQRDLVNALKVLNGLGEMAASYVRNLRMSSGGPSSGARTHMPYFLQVEPQIFAPIALSLITLVNLSQTEVASPILRRAFCSSLCSMIAIAHAHLASISLLRVDTSSCREPLRYVGDALLYVVFMMDGGISSAPGRTDRKSPALERAVTDPQRPRPGDSPGAGSRQALPVQQQPSRGRAQQLSELPSMPNSASAVSGVDAANKVFPGATTFEPRHQLHARTWSEFRPSENLDSSELGSSVAANDDDSPAAPAELAGKALLQHLRVVAPSNQAQSRFLAQLWKRTRSKVKMGLRRQAAEALVAERAISYLIGGPDSPRPLGEARTNKRRLARVLGVSDSALAALAGKSGRRPASSEFRSPSFSLLQGPRNLFSLQGGSRRHMSLVEDGEAFAGRRTRHSSITRRDSIQNRVRVRSVLGETKTGPTTSSMLKRRSQALLTIQRAARSFMRSNSAIDDHRSTTGPSPRMQQTEGSSRSPGAAQRRAIALDEVETLIYSENSSLLTGRIPVRIVEWIEDSRHGSDSPVNAEALGQAQLADAMVPTELQALLDKVSEVIPHDLSLASSPVNEDINLGQDDFVSTLLQAVVESDDVPSAVVLRCLQDDMISRQLILLESARRPGRNGSGGATPTNQASGPVDETSAVEDALLAHSLDLFNACADRSSVNPFRTRLRSGGSNRSLLSAHLPSSPAHIPSPSGSSWTSGTNGTPASEGSVRCLLEDVACELMERFTMLADWERASEQLSAVLLELAQGSRTPAYMKACATQLLCSFAKAKMKSPSDDTPGAFDEHIESLLFGPLFALPASSKDFDDETTEVFLQELARSPAQPAHQSQAIALHEKLSGRPELRMLTMQTRGKPSVLEDVVRISAAVFLKHTGSAKAALNAAYQLVEEGEITPADTNLLVQVWKAAWDIARTVISVFRGSQRNICSAEGCRYPVVADNGSWRCEVGHVANAHDVEETLSYQEICAAVAARARILLNLGVAFSAAQPPAKAEPLLQHARRFICSAASDDIKSNRLELYLKAKERISAKREHGLRILRDTVQGIFKVRATSEVESSGAMIRSATIHAAASRGAEFVSAGTLRSSRGSFGMRNERPILVPAADVHFQPVLETIREAVVSMRKHPSAPAHHPLDFMLPSRAALGIQQMTLDIVDLVLRVCEEAVGFSQDSFAALRVLQVLSLHPGDHVRVLNSRIIPRLLALIDRATEAEEDFARGALWSIFARLALQAFDDSWESGQDGFGGEPASDDESEPLDDAFRVGFDDLQRAFAVAIVNQLGSRIVNLHDPSTATYEAAEQHCFHFLSLLGALCTGPAITTNFAHLLSTGTSRRARSSSTVGEDDSHPSPDHLMLALIGCSSPRIQQLAIRLARRVFASTDPVPIVPHLFGLAGCWALSLKGFSAAGRAGDLALELAGLLRYMAARYTFRWRPSILQECAAAAGAYLEHNVGADRSVLCRFWTVLAIFNVSGPATLRPGCRVKIVPGTGFFGWNQSRASDEYGIVIRMSKRSSGHVRHSALTKPGGYDSPEVMVILDSEPTKLPVKCDLDKVFPITIMLELYRDLFVSLRGSDWLIKSMELFTDHFWRGSLSQDLVWAELKAMAMSVLGAWLSADASVAIPQIAMKCPRVWRNVVAICAYPAPQSSLENVDDLSSTRQAIGDIKAVLCELGTCPLDSIYGGRLEDAVNEDMDTQSTEGAGSLGTGMLEQIDLDNLGDEVIASALHIPSGGLSAAGPHSHQSHFGSDGQSPSFLPLSARVSESFGPVDQSASSHANQSPPEQPHPGEPVQPYALQQQHSSLLTEPMLQPDRRAALARQASTQTFPQMQQQQQQQQLQLQQQQRQQHARESPRSGPVPVADSAAASPPPRRNGHTRPASAGAGDPLWAFIDGRPNGAVSERRPSAPPLRRNSLSRSYTPMSIGPIDISPLQPTEGGSPSFPRKKTVKFESPGRTDVALTTPFREMDRTEHSSYMFDLQVERNRRRARMERKRRAARRLRTLSSSSSIQPDGAIGQRFGGAHDHGYGPILCQPDTPRGRDAAALTLPVELPTVDTMLSVPLSAKPGGADTPVGGGFGADSSGTGGVNAAAAGQKQGAAAATIKQNGASNGKKSTSRRAVVRAGTLLRISQDETGEVKNVHQALNGNEVALIHIFNAATGLQYTSWRDIADLELSEDVIADRYRLMMNDQPEEPGDVAAPPPGTTRLESELQQLFSRSAILFARRAAVAAISGSVDSDDGSQMEPLVGEAGGASQILGMLKLCESSTSNEASEQTALFTREVPSFGAAHGTSPFRGLWQAVAVLFDTNDEFADMLLDEATLYLSMTAKDTLLFETPHPLCPLEEVASLTDDGSSVGSSVDEELDGDGATSIGSGSLSLFPSAASQGASDSETQSANRTFRGASSFNPMHRLRGSLSSWSSLPAPPSPRSSESVASETRVRKLSGSHRFCIKGSSGLLVEFDRRSSIISQATQVTLSYDPQDREVIKVLGEGGADAWQPVVVSGDTCYIHWNVNQSDILPAMQRLDELSIDTDEVAWGVAVRVRPLEEISHADELHVLERPFGWRIMRVIADNPQRVLSRGESGIHFFSTAVSYLRAKHLASKPELCELLTLVVKARMSAQSEENGDEADSEEEGDQVQSDIHRQLWDTVMRQGLYNLHHDLLIMFDEVAEDGFTSVSPYFVCLLEMLVLCRPLWALQAEECMEFRHSCYSLSSDADLVPQGGTRSGPMKAPLCSLVVLGQRVNSKVVMDCDTCRCAVCVACAATCHVGHKLRNERTTKKPCSCSARGPEFCKALRPNSDVWTVNNSERTWFDVVCQTAEVINAMSTGAHQIPRSFVQEAYRTCEDGKLLRLCLRSLEECLRSESQEVWWDRDARHMWANMLDQGMDTVAEVAFGLGVLMSSLLPSAFNQWWEEQKEDWLARVYTNQAWALAQAMLQFNYALAPSACYTEWDARLQNWTATLTGIADLGDDKSCTFLLTGEFPRQQLYVKCRTCDMEICEFCAERHAKEGHELMNEFYDAGFCDERTQLPPSKRRPRFERFSECAKSNFEQLHDLYWMCHDHEGSSPDEPVPSEPRTLAALLNVPSNAFAALSKPEVSASSENSGLVPCISAELCSMLSPCYSGLLFEILGIKEGCDILCVSCDADHGLSLAISAILTSGGRVHGAATVHGFASSPEAGRRVMHNLDVLREGFGAPLATVQVHCGDILAHARAVSSFGKKSRKKAANGETEAGPVKAIPGLKTTYDRIICNGVCTLEQIDALSALLPLDGALLCPMVSSLGYGIYVQRNQFSGECESRTLAPLYQNSEKFLREIEHLQPILPHAAPPPIEPSMRRAALKAANCGRSAEPGLSISSESTSPETAVLLESTGPEIDSRWYEAIRSRCDILKAAGRQREVLMTRVGEPWALDGWVALADFAGRQAGRDTTSLAFRDLNARTVEAFPLLEQVADLDVVRGRFAVLKRVNDSLSEVLPLVNLTPLYSTGGIGRQLSRTGSKRLVFLSTKLDAWAKVLEPNWSDAPASSMPSITVSRKLADLGLVEDSLFMQTYNQVQNFPPCSLRRRDQSFKVRFAGEGGHDVGGLYRDLFSEMCAEMREGRPPILFHPPRMADGRGEPLLPRPSLTSPLNLRLFEFLGSLVGIAGMRRGITLSIDMSPLLWKSLVRDMLTTGDLRFIDEVALQTVSFVRRATRPEFQQVFSDTVFALDPIDADYVEPGRGRTESIAADGGEVAGENVVAELSTPPAGEAGQPAERSKKALLELCPLGKERKVTFQNALEFGHLVESFRLNECNVQIDAMKRGMAPLVPTRLLPMFTWQELENLVCGVADVDVEFLHSRTKYVGGVKMTDSHIKFFWEVLVNDFTPEDRTQFLRFVWGRERMSTAEEGNTFIIGPHLRARDSGDPDKWLPVAHTCFFSLDLPPYTSRDVMKERLQFAITNCSVIDGDQTAESASNMNMSLALS